MSDNLTEEDLKMAEVEIEIPEWMAHLFDVLHGDLSAFVIDVLTEELEKTKQAIMEEDNEI